MRSGLSGTGIQLTRSWGGPAVAIAFFAAAALWFSWPGLATHDTLFLTREAIEGQFTTYHPLLNGLLLRALAVPCESYAPYTVAQVALCATLFGRALMLVFGPRVDWRAWTVVLVWALGGPALIYLGMIWKDVPIAYALTYLAALAYRLRSEGSFAITRWDAWLFGAALVAAVCLRHGMAFNLVAVPLAIGIARLRRDRRLLLPYVGAVLITALLFVLSHTSLVKNDKVHMLQLEIGAVSQPFLGIVTNRNGYTSDDFAYDNALATALFGPGYASEYTPDYFRNQVVPTRVDELRAGYRAVLQRTPRLCLLNMGACLGGRLQMFLGTLQPSTRFGGMTFYDLGSMPSCESVYGMDPERCRLLWEFESGSRGARRTALVNAVQGLAADARGSWQNLVLWNLLPAAALLALLLVFSRPANPLWVVAAFFAVQCGLPFATAMANDFRYYYFLSPFLALFGIAALAAIGHRLRLARS